MMRMSRNITGRTGGRMVLGAALAVLVLLALSAAVVSDSRADGSTLDINKAGVEQLASLPGIGPAKARAIVANRDENGPFASVDDLVRVRGVGAKVLEKIRPMVTAGP